MKRDDLLDLNDALQHPGRKIAVDIETGFENDPEFELASPLTGFLEAVSTGNLLLLNGEFKASVIVGCARCGEPLEEEVNFQIEEQFPVEGVPSSYSASDFARVVADEPYPLFEGNALMVEPLLRQDLLVSLPMQTLCQYGWEGECPIAAKRKISVKLSDDLNPFQSLKRLRAEGESETDGQ